MHSTVELAPTRQQEGRELHAVDVFYTWAAEQTTTTTAPPEPATEESQHLAHFDPGSVQQLIVDVFGDAAPTALRVAKCESNYRSDAVNRSNPHVKGVFQIHDSWADEWLAVMGVSYWETWMDAETNIRFAYWLYTQSGWGPWECS